MADKSISRSDQYKITVSIEGIGNWPGSDGVWDKMTGGDKDSDELKYHPGGMSNEISLGGKQTVNNITLQRIYDTVTHDGIGGVLDKVGKAVVTVTKHPLDEDKVTYGTPLVYKGRLKRVQPPEVDSDATNASLVEMEISSATVVQSDS